jgi:hypothetical protein
MRFDDDRIGSNRVMLVRIVAAAFGADCPPLMLLFPEPQGMRFSCARGGATSRRP